MKFLLSLFGGAALVAALHDNTVRLTKPPLRNNLDDLEKGLEDNLKAARITNITQWTNGYIPQDCKNIANNEGKSPADFLTYAVTYEDCGDPWIFCQHKNAEVSVLSMAVQFSKLPIQMREYVKHVVAIPSPNGYAYMSGANIVFFRPVDNMVTVFVHETGHSLDLNGAYGGSQLSPSDNWFDNYNQDTNVPDPYSQSNFIEDVAQNTVVAVYNENVPAKFGSVEPNWNKIFHQYATVITVARNSGSSGTSIIGPSPGQRCARRIPPSTPVPATSSKTRRDLGAIPDVSLNFAVPIALPAVSVSTKGKCGLHW